MKALALLAVGLMFCSACAFAGEYLMNDTGEAVTGLRLVFSEPVCITSFGDVLLSVDPRNESIEFVFSGGELEAWGGHWLNWEPATATIVEYEWLDESPSVPAPTDTPDVQASDASSVVDDGPLGAVPFQSGGDAAGAFSWSGYLSARQPKEIRIEVYDESYLHERHVGGVDKLTIVFLVFHDDPSEWGNAIQNASIETFTGPGGYVEKTYVPVTQEQGEWVGEVAIIPSVSMRAIAVWKHPNSGTVHFGVNVMGSTLTERGLRGDQEVHHNGDIWLDGGDVMEISEQTYYQNGSIYLSGSAKLVLRNASLILQQTYHEEHNVYLDDRAQIEVVDSEIASDFDLSHVRLTGQAEATLVNAWIHGWLYIEEGGTVNATDSEFGSWASYGGIIVVDSWESERAAFVSRASLTLRDSTVRDLSLNVHTDCQLDLLNFSPDGLRNWSLTQDSAREGEPPFDIALNNVSVRFCNLGLGGRGDHVLQDCEIFQLTIEDEVIVRVEGSSVEQVILRQSGKNLSLTGLQPGLLNAWTLDLRNREGPKLVFNGTHVGGWSLRLEAGNYTIRESSLIRLRPGFDDRASSYELEHCDVDELLLWWSHGIVRFNTCTVHTFHTPDSATTSIEGSVEFATASPDEMFGPWRNQSRIERIFRIELLDDADNPVASARLQLVDSKGGVVTSLTTDGRGQARFSLRFDELNYGETWTLRHTASDLSAPVYLLASTPIVLCQACD